MRPYEIQVKTNLVPDNRLLHLRNEMALQSAIIRGDTEVLLHNYLIVLEEYWKRIRHSNLRLNKRYNFRYSKTRLESRIPEHLDAATARRGIDDVQWKGFRFEFIKILAVGGHGYVSLWRVWFEDGSSKKVVIKRDLRGYFAVDDESYFHLRYAGAEHTSQVLDLHAEAMEIQDQVRLRNPLARLRYRNGAYFNARSLKLIVFEYMDHGDLYHVLTLAGHNKVQFLDRTLWGIWECLVRGVAAVAYVPSFLAMYRNFDKELQTAMDTNRLEHFLAQLENIQQSHDVHLDLEELNVLAGTADSHPYQPIFKLHDLGAYSWTMSDCWKSWDDCKYWQMRKPCKIHRVAPEQVHQDWDQLRTDGTVNMDGSQFAGEDLTQGHRIAGRFGTWTNIFLIGKVMEAVITLFTQSYPFDAFHFDSMDGTQSGKTYGWLLDDESYSHVDPALRDMIMRCQLEAPGERPSITTLLREIANRKSRPFYQSPGDMACFWENFFGPKPVEPIPDPIDDDLADALEASMAGGMIPWHPDPGSKPHRHEQQADSAPEEQLEYFHKWMSRQARALAAGDGDQTPRAQQPAPGNQGQQQIPRRPVNLRVPQRIARRPAGDQPVAAAPSRFNAPSLESVDLDDTAPTSDSPEFGDTVPFSRRAGEPRANFYRARAEPDGSVSESGSDISPVPTARKGVIFNVPKSSTRRGQVRKTGSRYDKSKMLFPNRKEAGSRVNKQVSEPNTKSLKTCVEMSNLDKFTRAAMDEMPMAIRNLMARTKHLERRLAAGNLPAMAYITPGGNGEYAA
ncbi:hypothetical protein N0V84_010457 [Fusarium piperis]|uniref:Protein kinase domain-containing protein n=1 Tax=Fusarium piperis TaxID=1435070 RepID=A0A9W8TE05_9HYPO|nr:hypothetical protein N0V84_010457 [Fusarium piperis]